jgi:hypothetical protein
LCRAHERDKVQVDDLAQIVFDTFAAAFVERVPADEEEDGLSGVLAVFSSGSERGGTAVSRGCATST